MKRPERVPTLQERASGVLLHLTSLPGPHGNGDLGTEARAFADALARAGQRWWQMLPVGPAGYGDSPYSAQSSFAGNPLLVDLDALGEGDADFPVPRRRGERPDTSIGHSPEGRIGRVTHTAHSPEGRIDFEAAAAFREKHLRIACDAFSRLPEKRKVAFRSFVDKASHWLEDFALFTALKRAHGGVEWTKWERGVRLREPRALARARNEHRAEIELAKFIQWKFDEQWQLFRAHCRGRGIGLIGDIPIFVAHDSADVWQHRELFMLDDDGAPIAVAGVPPDYFSATGQRWGNPLYRWRRLAKTGYAWWVERLRASLDRFDALRLDHFIGFVRYWRIPATERTAMNGTWMKGPGNQLFHAVQKELGRGALPFIAEDLGAVTRKVTNLRRELDLPGMRIVQFAFGEDPQVALFRPYNHEQSSVVYTGTHDNDTLVGWFCDRGDGTASTRSPAQTENERQAALAYLGRSPADLSRGLEIHWEMIRLAMSSVARTAIVPMQDILGLGSEARMNSPGRASGNWRWRLLAGAFTPGLEARLREMTRTYGRERASEEQKS